MSRRKKSRSGRLRRSRSLKNGSRALAENQQFDFEKLEDRNLLAANLFVDFGDNFPGGILATTQGAFRDIANAPAAGDRILGTTLEDSMGNFNAATGLNILTQTFSANDREQMMAVVRRAYEALDINVFELTSVSQTTVDGRNVAAASSMTDVINTLRAGNSSWKDAYVFVAEFVVDPGGANEQTYTGGSGTSPGGSNGTVLDTTDLSSAINAHDDVAVVFSDGGFSYNNMNNISHEAGHLFGLRHAITNRTGTIATNLFHQAEIMSYRNTNNTSSSTFSRFPMIRGDSNSPEYSDDDLVFDAATKTITRPATSGDFDDADLVAGMTISITGTSSNNGNYVVQSVTPSIITLNAAETLVDEVSDATIRSLNTIDYNDLSARMGQVTIYDQMRLDANILAAPNRTFVSGTGANDIITITRNGAVADVTVQAFADSAFTLPITVPGEADSVYSYSIPLTNTILIHAGDSDDRIFIDGDLGIDVRIDGMLGNDTLTIDGNGVVNAVYTPNLLAPVGVDFVDDYGGSIEIGTNLITFYNFESGQSTLTLHDFLNLRMITPGGVDDIQIEDALGLRSRIDGDSGGVDFVPLEFFDVANVFVDLGVNDVVGNQNDVARLDDRFSANGLTNFTLATGDGSDIFELVASDTTLPVAGGLFLFDGELGTDTLDDLSNSANSFVIDGVNGGTFDSSLVFANVENLDGGSSTDEFRFAATGRLDGFVEGRAGDNEFNFAASTSQNVMLNALGFDTGFGGNVASNLLSGGFRNINQITGSSLGTTDSITGLNDPATWTINNNDIEYSSTNTLDLLNFDSLVGGSMADFFDVEANNRTLEIDGGGDSDFLDNETNAAGTFIINNGNAGSFNTQLTFSSIEDLDGDEAADEFRFMNSGFLSRGIDGKGGFDHFNFAAMPSQDVSLSDAFPDGWDGSVAGGNLVANGFKGIDRISGSSLGTSDRINGVDFASNWVINNSEATYMASTFMLALSNFETYNGGNLVDSFMVQATNAPIAINGNDGDDTYYLGSAAPVTNVDGILATVNINGGNGSDMLEVVDTDSLLPNNVTVTTSSITGIAPGTINYAGNFPGTGSMNGVMLRGSDTQVDTVLVDSFLAANTLRLETNGGNDAIETTIDAFGDMRIDGGQGFDDVRIHFINDTRRINAHDSGTGQTDQLFLYGLTESDHIVVRPTSVARNVTDRVWHDAETEQISIMSRDGDDVFSISGTDARELYIQTGNGDDFARVLNTGNAQQMNILTGRDSDRVRVRETMAHTSLNVNTQHDADYIFVGSNKTDNDGSLDRIRGPLNVVGGNNAVGEEDRLYINDHATVNGQRYQISDSAVTSLSPRTFTTMAISQMELVRLEATDQADEFEVTPSTTTRFFVGGNLPTRHEISCAADGDFLNLVTDASSGRRLYIPDRANGNGAWVFSNGQMPVSFSSIERFNHVERLAIGADAFLHSEIRVLDAETRDVLFTLNPFESTFTGGVRVATGDVTGDGIPDIVAASGAGRQPWVNIYDGYDGAFVNSFLAYGHDLQDGVFVAVGDVGGDCGNEIITSIGPGRGNAEVRVWRQLSNATPYQLADYFQPFGSNFYGGASVAVGDFNGDGTGDIAVGALHGRAHVAVFDGSVKFGQNELARFLAFDENFYGGVHVATGNVRGDATVDLIVSAGENHWHSSYDSRIHVFDGSSLAYSPGNYVVPNESYQPFSGNTAFSSLRVIGKDHDMDGTIDELFMAHGPSGERSTIKVLDAQNNWNLLDTIFETDDAFDHGIFVG